MQAFNSSLTHQNPFQVKVLNTDQVRKFTGGFKNHHWVMAMGNEWSNVLDLTYLQDKLLADGFQPSAGIHADYYTDLMNRDGAIINSDGQDHIEYSSYSKPNKAAMCMGNPNMDNGQGGWTADMEFDIPFDVDYFVESELIAPAHFPDAQLLVIGSGLSVGGIHTVKVQVFGGREGAAFPSDYLKSGVEFIKLGNIQSREHSQTAGVTTIGWSSIKRKYKVQFSTVKFMAEYHTRALENVANYMVSDCKVDSNNPLRPYMGNRVSFLNKLDMEFMMDIKHQISMMITHSRQTNSHFAKLTGETIVTAPGLRQWRTLANTIRYDKNTSFVEGILDKLGALNYGTPQQYQMFEIEGGAELGKLISRDISNIFKGQATVVQYDEYVYGAGGLTPNGQKGNGLSIKPFTEYKTPAGPSIRFKHVPAYDNPQINRIKMPGTNKPLSSYEGMVTKDSSGRPSFYMVNDTTKENMFIKTGTHSPYGKVNESNPKYKEPGDVSFDGYRQYYQKRFSTYCKNVEKLTFISPNGF